MDRRQFLKGVAGAGVAALGLAGEVATARNERKQPNFVIILADDLGYHDIGCFGAPKIKTPNIDALAREGVRFTSFYSNGAVCSPTRTALVTGRYQQRAAIENVLTAASRKGGLPAGSPTFASVLKGAGYVTALCGKWHLGYDPQYNPVHYGFDRFRGYLSGNVDYISHYDQNGVADWWENDALKPESGYSTHLITRHAVEFIEAHKDEPFCLYVAHEAGHYPYQVPGDPPLRGTDGTADKPRSKDDEKYAVMIGELDKGVGEVVAALARCGLRENTLVFFVSDNGGVFGNGDLRAGKSSLFEGGIRVPAVANWPGRIKPATPTDAPAITMDLMPTMLAIAGVQPPAGHKLDGVDLSSLLLEGRPPALRTLFWRSRMRAVREGDWKLVLDGAADPMLFNLKEDIGEKNDLAAAQPEKVKALLEKLATWEKDVDADGAQWRSQNVSAGAENEGGRKKGTARRAQKGKKKKG